MQTSRSYNTASSSSLRYLHGPPPLPLPLATPTSSSSTTHIAPVQEGSSKSVDHIVSTLPSSPSFVRSQAASFERRIKQHAKASERKKPSYVPPVPPLPSSSKDTRSPCSPKTLNVRPHAEQAPVLNPSPTPAKASLGSALPIRKSTVRKKPAPPVSPSLHAELHKSPKAKAKKVSDRSAPGRPIPVWGINSSTLSLGLGITFNDDNNERAYALGQDAVHHDELTATVSPVPDTQESLTSPRHVVRVDDVDRNSSAPNTAVPAQGKGESGDDSGRFPTPLPSTTSDSYDLALLEVDRAFHARIELTLRAPGGEAEAGPVERPIRRGASSITLGRARSLRQTSIRAAETSVRSASASATVRSSPNVSKWLASIDADADPRSEAVFSTDGLDVGYTLPTASLDDNPARQQPTPRAEMTSRPKEERSTPAVTRAPSLPNISLFRNKSISTLRRTLSRSRSSQKRPDLPLHTGTQECNPTAPERRVTDSLTPPTKGVHTPKLAHTDTLKRSRPQQKQRQWWEHALVVVGAASPGAFY